MALADVTDALGGDKKSPERPPHGTEVVLQLKRSRLSRLMGVQVIGVGSSAPDNCIRNEDLAALGYDADWIVQRTGIVERRHALPGTATSDLAVAAAERCIAAAGVSPRDIDFLLLGTVTPDRLIPATASVVQERLGLLAPAMDVHASCASFIYAMITGMQYVANGCSRLVLVIGADCNSRMVNPADRQTYPLFGDAAGAVLLAAGGPNQGLLGYAVGSDGAGADLLCRPMGGSLEPFNVAGGEAGRHFLHMEGRPVFKWAIRLLHETIGEVLAASNMTLGEVDLVIFHQANMRIIRAVVEQLGLDPAKVVNNVDRYGNTSSASIPLALDEAYRQGRIRPGNHILFSGFGAGLAWGTVPMRW